MNGVYKQPYKPPYMRPAHELNKICGEAFNALQLPPAWKLMRYERIPIDMTQPEGVVQSIVSVYADKSTTGFNLKHYRIGFHSFSERLSFCEVTFEDYGKESYTCKTSNKTPQELNKYIQTNY